MVFATYISKNFKNAVNIAKKRKNMYRKIALMEPKTISTKL